MTEQPVVVFRVLEEISVIGTMAVYESQADVSKYVPRQWCDFRATQPALSSSVAFYGASPCTDDRKIHYLTGVAEEDQESSMGGERLILEAGEYAVVRVPDASLLRDTWTWLLGEWLPASGRREKHTPEFEKFTGITEFGAPIAPIEIGIPLEPLAI